MSSVAIVAAATATVGAAIAKGFELTLVTFESSVILCFYVDTAAIITRKGLNTGLAGETKDPDYVVTSREISCGYGAAAWVGHAAADAV